MDSTRIVIALASTFVVLFTIGMGFRFISAHWNDIKELLTIALVLGAGFTVAIGGLKFRSGH